MAAGKQTNSALYRTIWRWHFYAGLFVIPFILILSVTGAIYLFKPQVERWEERAFRNLPVEGTVSPDAQRKAALAAFPGARVDSYRIPEQPGDAVMIHLALSDGTAMRDVFVSPRGEVVGSLDPEWRIEAIAHDIHGQLLLGSSGSWLVELAASWAIVMILSGLCLWWPRRQWSGRGLAGVIWPRLAQGSRIFWRDLHAVTGFWVAGLAMILLLTGLPWADVWGSAFKAVRAEMGWTKGQQHWTIGGRPADSGEHAGHMDHDHMSMMHMPPQSASPITLNDIVRRARAEHLAYPVLVVPPGISQRFGGKATMDWTVKSDTQNRPQRVSIQYDASTGKELNRETFADKHPIDRVIGYGIAWHEGALFGLANQLVGAFTALALVALSVSGFVLWRKRKPGHGLGAPPLPSDPARLSGIGLIVLAVAAFLPLLALSLLAILAFERLILPRWPAAASWLGVALEMRTSR